VWQEAHGGGSGRQRVVLFLFDQLSGELQRRADVIHGQSVFTGDLIEPQAASHRRWLSKDGNGDESLGQR
jgi:hypothetical protein